ncbi:metal-dependent transcriptional regulator [Clostridium sp. MT-14]|uniref:Manganese transport regulator n=1 Tax=Clostridium aromativorans TaxID=2836848 RepID=A0ABS8N5R4_9CLOT|nr:MULTISPECIES: iron dependent repressor, metal binding and dimerization domain protein [Clostridium]KAA8662562.1 Fur family transcriptional regulator [Clostridium sp. HV4-5-A1G]MCC9295151.1 Fur family transcriptional regulator [Clostridium aromativorans]CAB1248155.1 Transcriptional regulator MntR [Clostridiaceae bacterium BL-3]
MTDGDFFTFSEYMKKEYDVLTASMEDYLEMTYRLAYKEGFTRIHELAKALNVQPPSATKMIQKLAELKFIKYEKYGIIILTEEGKNMGQYLLNRHNIVESFLKVIGISENVLEQTEKVEHTINNQTIMHLKDFIDFVHTRPDVIEDFITFRNKRAILNKNSK